MKITDVRIRKVEGQSRLRAIASITIDDAFAVHELRIIEGKEGLFVAMPSKEVGEGKFKDIAHPINAETRELVEKTVLEKYAEVLKEEL
jgi:stage V sporulation protein G